MSKHSLKESNFYTLRHVTEVYDMAQRLAASFPNPGALTGVYELLINAIEHGNLEIGFEEKTILLRQGTWHEEIMRRLAMSKYSGRHVEIGMNESKHFTSLTILDQGNGFDWRTQVTAIRDGKDFHGRGIAMAMNAGFSRLFYNEKGNAVTCEWSKDSAEDHNLSLA